MYDWDLWGVVGPDTFDGPSCPESENRDVRKQIELCSERHYYDYNNNINLLIVSSI